MRTLMSAEEREQDKCHSSSGHVFKPIGIAQPGTKQYLWCSVCGEAKKV